MAVIIIVHSSHVECGLPLTRQLHTKPMKEVSNHECRIRYVGA
ncbi:hypothetical protein [Paenibacillus sp. ISL-20]|nr:hypothetical protein [Paenibacillus sp. ISL-20]